MFLVVENCFPIKLGVLSSVLYGWRSLEPTATGGPKPRGRRLNSRTSENTWLQATLTDKRPPKSIHTQTDTKFHPRAYKFQCKTHHANSPGKKETSLNFKRCAAQSHTKPIGTPRLTTGHFIELQREEIHLHSPEHQHKFPQPGNPGKPLVQPHPQEADSTTNRKHNLPSCRNGTPTHQSKQNEKAEKYSADKETW